ncbi:MAG: hypothetical protein ACRDJJ_08625, partial [Actinomycetota bacterium]
MFLRAKRIAAVAAAGVLAGLLVPGQASAATTYDIEVGQDFFESAGIPGFSLRSYPGSLNLMEGDTIRFFGFGSPLLLPEG